MTTDIETIVVGAGVVGLAIARELVLRGHEVLVLERNNRIGAETSSRNSEVIHAGLYYPPGSLRAKLCVDGKQMLYRFCEENGVAVRRYGKLLVATGDDEVPRLISIAGTAAQNGVSDLIRLSAADVRVLEPEIHCVGAYLSPSTGVIDSHGLMTAIEGHVSSHGGQVVLNSPVTGISVTGNGGFAVRSGNHGEDTTLVARNLVLAAGLGCSALGASLHKGGAYRPPQTFPAKGHYYALNGKAPFQRLVYPMPRGAWLGLHLTLDVAGRAKFGPDIEWRDEVSYNFEENGGERMAAFVREIRRYWPGLPDASLTPDYTGVRPKIYRQGEPAADFAIHGPETHGLPRLVALYGIESPGLTSCLAIGALVADAIT